MDRYIGRFLDNRYEILEIIGTGGMAVVYKARCHRLNRLVAIKILKDEFSRDEEFRRRFHAEGEAVASLSHPNIVQVYDVSSTDNANFIVMELIDGITLKQYMEKKGTLNWKETLHFAMQIAKALEHAHGRSIVHRDIKPHNVMVLKNGSVKVTDFGIARVMSKSNTLTKEALGSVHYISPEQAKGGWVDNRSDLYSLSVVMYEMMTGRPPYDGESPVAVAIKHINGGAPMPSTLNPNIPGGLEQIIMKGMELDTKDRYSSATEMLQDMDQFRMDPAILFNFGKPVTTDATIVMKTGEVAEAIRQSRTTAEKVAGQAGAAPKRPAQQGAKPATQSGSRSTAQGTPGQQRKSRSVSSQTGRTSASAERPRRTAENISSLPPRKTREEIRREVRAEERNRAATIAVVACSAVAVIAIIIFLVVLVNGGLVGHGEKMVTVPNLVGQYYEQTGSVTGVVIEIDQYVNSDEFEKGKITYHTPEYGAQVEQGTVVKVTVSLGPEPEVKTMSYMVGYQEADARAVLTGMGMVPVAMEEFSDFVEKGKVARTDPEVGTVLTEGQTVYIYISKGPMIETAVMPNVVGLNYATAKKQLEDLGFTTVTYEAKDSKEDKDEVIGQPFPEGEKVDLTMKIVLTISKGNKTTGKEEQKPVEEEDYPDYPDYPADTPSQNPVQPPSQSGSQSGVPGSGSASQNKTKEVTFSLPTNRTEQYLLGLYQGGMQVIEDTLISPDMTSIKVVLTGSGVQYYDLYINNQFYKTVKVDFDAND